MGKEQYDLIAEEYSHMFNPTKKFVIIPTFKKIISNVQGKKTLDLACGEGFFTRMLANLNPYEIVGIDFSEELIKKAIEIEFQNPLNISYSVRDVLTLNLDKKFDLITAVYLLNYAQNKNELNTMCKTIYDHLDKEGKFSTITTNPALKQMTNFEYERRFTSVTGKILFEDGDKIKCEMNEEGKKPFDFVFYYWSKGTYEQCLRNAGFKSVKWVDAIISPEGIKEYGDDYWNKFKQNPSFIGIVCEK